MRDEKEERKKQARSNKQTRQSNTAHPTCTCTCIIVQCMYTHTEPCFSFVCLSMNCYFQVVKMKGTGKVFALKILNKVEMLKRHQVCTCTSYMYNVVSV